jgi:hypothetical protein
LRQQWLRDYAVVPMTLPDGEPAAGPWRVERLAEAARILAKATGSPIGRPTVVAIDGRSSSGKSTLASRLASCHKYAHVVHTDDVAWHHSIFGWTDLLIDNILGPVRLGQAVSFRPPAWETRGRPGVIDVPAGISILIVEGVGAARRELVGLVDASVWVQSDQAVMDQRSSARISAGEVAMSVHEEWMAEEVPFVAAQRPWERADLIVAGTAELPHDPDTEVVVAPPMAR